MRCMRCMRSMLCAVCTSLALAGSTRPLRAQTDTEVRRAEAAGQVPIVRRGAGSPCAVVAVLDGDTFTCLDGRTVRLLLLDAPELSTAAWGARSRAALADLLPQGRTVWLAFEGPRADVAGRALAYVFTNDDILVNWEMVSRGFALALPMRGAHTAWPSLRSAEASARAAHRGLWADAAFQPCPLSVGAGRRDLPPCPTP